MPTILHSGFSSENLTFDHKSRCAEQHPDYRLHMHDTLELFFLKKGNVTYLTTHDAYPLQPGSLVISRPFELHSIQIHEHRLFTLYLQTSPKQYILSQKLFLAKQRLQQGIKPTEVAAACGFTNYTTFYRDYKKHFGHTPSAKEEVFQ